jgi:2-polyprenyl-6-methoxyphenol hydroxylase-like FAD-dependent oxidoreductase
MGDFEDRSGLGTEAHLFFTPQASVESFPLPGGLRRWIVLANERGTTPSAEYLVRSVHRLTGHDLSGLPISFLRPFGARRLEVESYHRGRVVLAGDAAHVMSSIGGQGMNTGFADAEMLADQLAYLLQDEDAASGCFALYDRVRRQAFRVAAARAERGMWLGTLRGRAASRLRKWFIRDLLFSSCMERRLAPHFAMLTIPFRNLNQVPREWWPASSALS